MIILPAMDVLNNKVVRLIQGDYNSYKIYNESINNQATFFESNSIEWIHFVDLLASKTGVIETINNLKWIKNNTNLKIQFGGGIRSIENIDILLNIGIDSIVLGTSTVNNKNLLQKLNKEYDTNKFVIAADIKDDEIYIKGWTENTGINIINHIELCNNYGFNKYLVTDINKDGMMTSPDYDIYKKIQDRFKNINLFVSGGVKDLKDLEYIKSNNYYGAIVGKAFYENKITIEEIKKIVN